MYKSHPKLTKIAGILVLLFALTAGTCTGPVEFTSGLPKQEDVDFDERLSGWWYTVKANGSSNAELSVLMVVLPNYKTGELMILWYLPGMGACWAAVAYPSKIDDIIYYDAIRIPELDQPCEDYTEKDRKPGHIITQVDVDQNDRLFLSFVSSEFFDTVLKEGVLETHVAESAEEKKVVDEYLVVEISEENLIELLRESGAKNLFTEPYGPFYRIDLNEKDAVDTLEPWDQ